MSAQILPIHAATKAYEFPMSRNYVQHWGVVEAVREILQNALDSESIFEYRWNMIQGEEENDFGNQLLIFSQRSQLSVESLLLGNGSKADDPETIGHFGEGYKLALLVLTRLSKAPVVWNNERIWRTQFQNSEVFNTECFAILEAIDPQRMHTGLAFEINHLSRDEVQQIADSCLHMQSAQLIGEQIKTPFGTILPDRKGKLYVGGLFICETELEFGYDVVPREVRLERDRKTVDTWDLLETTKRMWFASNQPERVAKLMERNCPDLQAAEWGSPEVIKEACYNLFVSQHPEKVMAKNQEEMERLVKQGLEVKVYSGGYYGAVTSFSSYSTTKQKVQAALAVKSPAEQLKEYFERNKKNMRKAAIVEMKQLIEAAVKWKA